MNPNNQIEQIAHWQKTRNLDMMPYNHYNEIKNIIEECIEASGHYASEASRDMATYIVSDNIPDHIMSDNKEYPVDAYCDMIVYAVGAIMKLGYNPSLALNECILEINDRTGSYDIKAGKWVKEPKKPDAYVADYSKAKLDV